VRLAYLERNGRLRSDARWTFISRSNKNNTVADLDLRLTLYAGKLDAALVWQSVVWALAHAVPVVGHTPTNRDVLMAAARAANRLWGCRLRPEDASLGDIYKKIRAAVAAREVPAPNP
jgi:hypothetical protein